MTLNVLKNELIDSCVIKVSKNSVNKDSAKANIPKALYFFFNIKKLFNQIIFLFKKSIDKIFSVVV